MSVPLEKHVPYLIIFARILTRVILTVDNQDDIRQPVMVQILKRHCRQPLYRLFQLIQLPVIRLQLVRLVEYLSLAVGDQNRQTMVFPMKNGHKIHFLVPKPLQQYRETVFLNLFVTAFLNILHGLYSGEAFLIILISLNQKPDGFILRQSLSRRQHPYTDTKCKEYQPALFFHWLLLSHSNSAPRAYFRTRV